jgi:hypothetical protein
MRARHLLISTVLFATLSDTKAQFNDTYGKIRPIDVDVKECAFDPSASLVITLDEGSTDYNQFGEEVTYHHIRMKVLKEDGIRHANFSIRYPSKRNYVVIDQLEGKCINIAENGYVNEYPVEKKSIYTKKLNKYYSQVSFAFPQVKVGSILEYRYRSTNTKAWGVQDWNFQSDFPVYESSYRYKSHPQIEVSYALQKRPEYPAIIKPEGDAILFKMNNIPAMDEEPYMDGKENNLQKVRFQITKVTGWNGLKSYSSTWGEVAAQLTGYEGFGKYVNTKSAEVNDFVSSLTGSQNDVEKMKSIHNFVRKNILFNENEVFVTSSSFKDVWKAKKGSSAEINLLMVNMLRAAGLDANPILISERGNGRVDVSFPSLDQFNNVFAVVNIGSNRYILDGTDKQTPYNITPVDILNTMGLILDKTTCTLLLIQEMEKKYKNIVTIEGTLDENGKIKGVVQISSSDYSRLNTLKNHKDDPNNFVEKFVKAGLVNIQIDSFRISNIETDSLAVVQNFNFTTNIQNSGDYDFATLNLFSGLGSNPFIAESRVSDINFGFKKSYTINYVLTLPANKKLDAAPKTVQVFNADKSLTFTRNVVYSEQSNQVISRIKVEMKRSLFKPSEYSDVKNFFKQLSNMLDEQCAIKNK